MKILSLPGGPVSQFKRLSITGSILKFDQTVHKQAAARPSADQSIFRSKFQFVMRLAIASDQAPNGGIRDLEAGSIRRRASGPFSVPIVSKSISSFV
jgi:hypothetical protein